MFIKHFNIHQKILLRVVHKVLELKGKCTQEAIYNPITDGQTAS